MCNMLHEFGYSNNTPNTLYIDNKSAICVAKNPEHHGCMKQLDLQYFWLRDAVDEHLILPEHLQTDEQPADLLTKPLCPDLVQKFKVKMGLT